MRVSVACPDCEALCRLLVVGGRTRGRCTRCEQLFDLSCVHCRAEPPTSSLTGDTAHPRCGSCEASLALEATPVVDRGRTAVGEPRWGEVILDEGGGDSPYRDGQPTRLRVSRRPGYARRLLATWALTSAPGLVPAAVGWWWAGVAWASGMALMVVAGSSPIRALDVSSSGARVIRLGFSDRVREIHASRVRRVGWAGRGARCHVYVQTDDRALELLFDGLTPPQAEVLEGKIARLLGV